MSLEDMTLLDVRDILDELIENGVVVGAAKRAVEIAIESICMRLSWEKETKDER